MNAFPSKSLSDNRKSAIQNRKWAGLFVIVVAFTVCGARAEAQQPTKVPRIGYLSATSPSTYRPASRHSDRVCATLATWREKTLSLSVDMQRENLIGCPRWRPNWCDSRSTSSSLGSAATRVAKKATVTIPIVMRWDSDPVGDGFVASLARPGGNITGLPPLGAEIPGKRLELLKEIRPQALPRGRARHFDRPRQRAGIKSDRTRRRPLRVQLQFLDVPDRKDIETAFRAATKGRADAVIALTSPILFWRRTQIAGLAVKNRLPPSTTGPII